MDGIEGERGKDDGRIIVVRCRCSEIDGIGGVERGRDSVPDEQGLLVPWY